MENSTHITCTNLFPISCNTTNINATSTSASVPNIFIWMSRVPIGISISTIGFIGNILSIIVWTKIRNNIDINSSTYIYFITMAVVDAIFLIFFILEVSTKQTFSSLMTSYSAVFIYCFVIFPFFFFFKLASIWIVVAVTIDRYLLVVLTTRISTVTTYLVLFIIFISCSFLNIPHFFNNIPQRKNGTGDSWEISMTDYGKSKRCHDYEFWIHCMFIILVPFIIIAPCNTAIIRKVWKASRTLQTTFESFSHTASTKSELSNSESSSSFTGQSERFSQNRKTTLTLVALTWTFILLLIWPCISKCFYMQDFRKDDPNIWLHVETSFAVSKLGIVINNSINCFFFCFTGSLFRKQLFNLFHIPTLNSFFRNTKKMVKAQSS